MSERKGPALKTDARTSTTLPALVRPLQEFLSTETAGGVLLVAAAVAALIWANLPGDSYTDVWNTRIILDFDVLTLDETLRGWINDGLMAIFFFVVGMEIKRELVRGELSGPRSATLPVAAAVGGMVVPALIYAAFNAGGDGARGWGIPMATDIAFAVGVLALLGTRVPLSLKIFLLALAIVDDIGAITVIAVFYTDNLDVAWMLGAALTFAATIALGQLGVRHLVVYLVAGVFAWLCLFESGIHPAIAGAMLGLLTPVRPYYEPQAFESTVGRLMLDVATDDGQLPRDDDEDRRAALREIEDVARDSRPVLDRLEQALHPWTSFAIIPLFALANAGVDLGGGIVRDAMSSPVSIGVVAGLVLGKPVGIVLFAFIATRIGVAALPEGVRWRELLGVAMVAGIGFTVSIFISGLAFTDQTLVEEAKIGIFAGSLLIATAGCFTLMWLSRRGNGQPA